MTATPFYYRSDLEVFNLLQHPTWIFDVTRKEMFWANRASLRIWNTPTLEELLSRDYKTDMSETTELRLNKDLNRVVSGEIIEDQWTLYPGGKATTMYTTGSAIRIRHVDDPVDAEGHIALLYECQRLVEQDKELQNEATRGVEMLRHLSIAVSQFNMQGKLQYQNPKAETLFDSKESEQFTSRFVDKELAKMIFKKVEEGHDYNVEAEHYTKQGPRWFFVSVKRTRDPISSENIILYNAQDITEVIEARKERRTVNEKSEFFAVIAHEIRTPLHQLVGYLDLFELDGLRDSQMEALRTMQSSSALLMSIINDLLDYTKLENGKLQLERIEFRAMDVVKSCIGTLDASATRKGLTLTDHLVIDNNLQLPELLIGDPNRIRQILLNFLSNSIKFTERGKISVNVSVVEPSGVNHDPANDSDDSSSSSSTTSTRRNPAHPSGCSPTISVNATNLLVPPEDVTKVPPKENVVFVRFEVSDTGIGIDPKHQATLFRKYQQANTSISRNYGGTGLGLAICKSLADLMGARIGLTSEVGVGTTAFLEVPFEIYEPKTPQVTLSSSSSSSSSNGFKQKPLHPIPSEPDHAMKLDVLVAEDNAVSQKMVTAMLKKLGHTVSVADNGQVAVDMASCGCYHVILMDVQMPIMDGIEATKKIRGMDGKTKNDLIIIGLTAGYESSDLEYYQGIGMNSCIGKPIRLDGLRSALCSAIVSRPARQ